MRARLPPMARIRLDYPDDVFVFSTRLEVRFDDINAGMHLANDRVVSLVGEARSRFLEHLGLTELGTPELPGTIVADLAVTYRAEARLRDVLRLDLGVTDANRYGGDVVCRLVRETDGVLVAVAKTGIVFFDYHGTKRPASAPQAFRDAAAHAATP